MEQGIGGLNAKKPGAFEPPGFYRSVAVDRDRSA
jgi:hypothetical protein